MKMKSLVLSSLMLSGVAMADTTLTYNNASGDLHSQMLLTDGMAKIINKYEGDTALIFNAQNNSFTVINHPDKSYMVFGEKEIAALGDISGMIDRMVEEQLAQMPASQREQMRGMIKSMMEKQMPKAGPKPEYEKNGNSKSFNGFDCDEVVQTVDGKVSGTFCVADHASLGVGAAEYESIASFMKIAEKMAAQVGVDQSMNFETLGQVLPVYYEMEQEKGFLTDVDNNNIDRSVFQVPNGYSKQSLPKELFQ